MLFLTPSQMVTKNSMLSYAKSNGTEKTRFLTPSQIVTQNYVVVSNMASTVTLAPILLVCSNLVGSLFKALMRAVHHSIA